MVVMEGVEVWGHIDRMAAGVIGKWVFAEIKVKDLGSQCL